jgi:FtsZ-binding cell division protein ZapB
MESEMSELMLPDESTWEKLTADELRQHLGSLKRSSNHVLLKVQELDRENKRLQKENTDHVTTIERLNRVNKTIEADMKAFEERAENAHMLLALYRELAKDPIALSVFDAALQRAEALTVWDAASTKDLAKTLFGLAIDESLLRREHGLPPDVVETNPDRLPREGGVLMDQKTARELGIDVDALNNGAKSVPVPPINLKGSPDRPKKRSKKTRQEAADVTVAVTGNRVRATAKKGDLRTMLPSATRRR